LYDRDEVLELFGFAEVLVHELQILVDGVMHFEGRRTLLDLAKVGLYGVSLVLRDSNGEFTTELTIKEIILVNTDISEYTFCEYLLQHRE
jgi:hypothetical protein